MSLQIRRLEGNKDEVGIVQQILEEAPQYSINVSGENPDQESGAEVFTTIPPKFEYKDKHVLGVYSESFPVGVIDLLVGDFQCNPTRMFLCGYDHAVKKQESPKHDA